ncbi:MAG: hypothetical protein D6761_04380 [Candidatus Dadabacteria bacterium]|nr:MAG: hypothetical protein D6761_04380 [Candidatus Dadabacteria bacterium]
MSQVESQYSSSRPVLRFLTNEAGEKEGLGDAGIETFGDAPYASCAREAGQNSRDAAISEPVRMAFNVLRIRAESFSLFPELAEAVDCCAAEVSNEREQEFFENARRVLTQPTIPVLEIADYNTTGLIGPPDEEGTPFHSLVKSSGVTVKDTAHAGGSYGIGKNASFAVSDLHAVLYATVWARPDTAETHFAAQGKVKLVSHTDKNGKSLRATGYWGVHENFGAITHRAHVPDWMNRTEQGTSIFALGFRITDDWAYRITASLIANFFCAIYRDEMVFEVDNGQIILNKNTLESLFSDESVSKAAKQSGQQSNLDFAQQLHRCLISDNSVEKEIDILDTARFRVRILVAEGLPKRVGFVRNGMLITDNLEHFGHRLARFPGSRDFVMLVEPRDSETSAFLKRLENPEHNSFSAERIPDPAKKERAKQIMDNLGGRLRALIKDETSVKHDGAVVLDELGRYFGDGGLNSDALDDHFEPDPERFTYKAVQRRGQKPTPLPGQGKGESGGSGRGFGDKSGDGGGDGSGAGPGTGGKGPRAERKVVNLFDVRNQICSDESTPNARTIYFTPDYTGPIDLHIEATGIDKAAALNLKEADSGVVCGNAVALDVAAGERAKVTVTLAEQYEGPIELVAYRRQLDRAAQ